MFVTERIKELSKQNGISVNFISRSYLNAIEKKFVMYRASGEPQEDKNGNTLYFLQHPETKTILAFTEEPLYSYPNDMWGNSPYHRIIYAFMSSAGKVLPDPECCGEIKAKTRAIGDRCSKEILQGFEPF